MWFLVAPVKTRIRVHSSCYGVSLEATIIGDGDLSVSYMAGYFPPNWFDSALRKIFV